MGPSLNLNIAMQLIRAKYLEETQGKMTQDTTETYLSACKDYPAVMNVAHALWARSLKQDPV